MKNTYKTIKYVAIAAFSLFAFVMCAAPQVTLAGEWDDWGYLGSGSSYYDATPVYSDWYDSGSYYDATPVYSDWYDYGGYDYGGYDYYTPSYSYSQPSYTPVSMPQYVYYNSNENENTNANSNTNTISNTFNPVNNNDAKINLIVYGGGTGTNTNTQQYLDGNCVATPSVVYVNQDVSFYANATGGNGSYSYSWTGTDGISASSQSFGGRFSYPGYKTVTVTIRSGSESITRTCNVTVNAIAAAQSNVTVIRDQNLGNPVSGVFLNEIPATGISFGLKMTLFTLGLVLWSIFAAYMIARKKGSTATFTEFASAGAASASNAIADKVAAFKLANKASKGIK